MLLAGECDSIAVHRVPANNVQNFGIFFTGRLEGFLPGGNVIEEILNLLEVSRRFRIA